MGRRLVILGAGESGVGTALLAAKKGYTPFVSDGGVIATHTKKLFDEHGISYEEGGHDVETILNAEEVMKSPGIPDKNEMVKRIREKKIPVISEIEFAYRYKGNSRIAAITGSNGKTTTTAMLFHICKKATLECALVGNIGYSFARQIAQDPKELYVAEISSFQLDDIQTFRPDVAILTNITEDHLDRYEYQFEKYISSKFRIAENQTGSDAFIYCADDPVTMQYVNKFRITSNPLPFTMNNQPKHGAFISNGTMTITAGDEKMQMSIYDFALKGKHNQYNTMAAGIAALMLGIR
ncbi:MAG: Mur ligase family protein, partial [Flavitalea sp.]